jgi:predicted ATP-grasp superfamily ATP-dependent carboligase
MARHQIVGHEYCPLPSCYSLSLGRYITKNVRNTTNGRYVKYYYYRHNDKKIPEHYVDNYVRKRQTELLQTHPLAEIIKLLNLLANDADKTVFLTQKVTEQVKNFPLTDNEALELNNYVKQKTEIITALGKIRKLLNLGLMLRIEGKEIPEWLQVEEQKLIHLAQKFDERLATTDRLVMQNPLKAIRKAIKIVESNPNPLYSVYEKYEFPKRLKRYKDAGKINSRWN